MNSRLTTSSLRNYRQALRYIIRNTTLPQRTRAQAQLQLSQMHAYTRPTQIKNRCVAGGIARSVFRDFRIARVSLTYCISTLLSLAVRWQTLRTGSTNALFALQYQFRLQALAGELPGVKKASW